MTTVDAELDPQVWIGLPAQWDETTWTDPRDWARETAEIHWAGRRRRRGEMSPDHLALTLLMHSENLSGVDFRRTFFWLPDPTVEPMPVHLECYVAEGDREEALRELGRTEPDGAVEPPVVEPFHSPGLGEGVRVIRYVSTDEGVVLVLSYAFRTLDMDVRLWLSTYDTAAALRVLDGVDDLARSLAVTD